MKYIQNKTVFITGASAGIGRACAIAFAEAGANLILTARRYAMLESLRSEILSRHQVQVVIHELDVTSNSQVKQLIEQLQAENSNIDILVNNAGLALGVDHLKEGNPEHWDVVIDTNIKGLLYTTRALLPTMIKNGGGHIINLGSVAGREVYPGGNVYCATKFAVNALTQALRIELINDNIRVTTIDPGMVETDFSKVRFFNDAERAANVYKGIHALTPEDIADTVLYCASRPPHVQICDVVITPSKQASVHFIVKDQA